MGFRATGNDIVRSALTTAHRRAIVNAGASVEDGSLRYWAPSKRARELAEIYEVARRAEDSDTTCMILTKYGRSVRFRLLGEQSMHAPDCQFVVNSADEIVDCSCGLIRAAARRGEG